MRLLPAVISLFSLALSSISARNLLQGTVLFIDVLGKGLTPRACVGDRGSIWWEFSFRDVFIKYRKSLPGEMTKHTPENTTLASNWAESKACVARVNTGNSLLRGKQAD